MKAWLQVQTGMDNMACAEKGGGSCLGVQLACPYHPGSTLVEDHSAGDMICPECGLVVGDRVIDVGSEWRTFSTEKSSAETRCRVGAAEDKFLEGKEITSYISTVTSKPGSAAPETNFSKWKRGGMGSADRALINAFREASNMAAKLNLPKSITDRCKALLKQVHQEKQLRGRAMDAVAAACLFIACRQEDVPRSFKEICAVSRHPKKEIGRCFTIIRQVTNTEVAPIAISDLMSRYCRMLQLPSSVQKAATHIAKTAVEIDLAPGRGYLSVAAAAIYMASQASEFKKSQKEVGDVVGVADTTVRLLYRLIYVGKEKLFPTDFEFVTPLDKLPRH